jgi:iron complex outermembrane receptor protein
MSISLFNRGIRNLMRRQTNLVMTSSGMRWVSQPFNISHATTSGIEMEAKFQLQEFLPTGPSMDVRSNFSVFRSKVDGIEGPNNRLDQQPGMTANLGLDYRLAGLPMTVGGNLNWTPGYLVQSSATQTSSAHIKRQLDLFGLWKFTPDLQLRISANNIVNNDYLTGSTIVQGGVNQSVDIGARTYTTWTARLEMKL